MDQPLLNRINIAFARLVTLNTSCPRMSSSAFVRVRNGHCPSSTILPTRAFPILSAARRISGPSGTVPDGPFGLSRGVWRWRGFNTRVRPCESMSVFDGPSMGNILVSVLGLLGGWLSVASQHRTKRFDDISILELAARNPFRHNLGMLTAFCLAT